MVWAVEFAVLLICSTLTPWSQLVQTYFDSINYMSNLAPINLIRSKRCYNLQGIPLQNNVVKTFLYLTPRLVKQPKLQLQLVQLTRF
jgi:hypothetical protein